MRPYYGDLNGHHFLDFFFSVKKTNLLQNSKGLVLLIPTLDLGISNCPLAFEFLQSVAREFLHHRESRR